MLSVVPSYLSVCLSIDLDPSLHRVRNPARARVHRAERRRRRTTRKGAWVRDQEEGAEETDETDEKEGADENKGDKDGEDEERRRRRRRRE